jgi:hypothetical protein
MYLSSIENEETLHIAFFMHVRPFATATGSLQGCNIPCLDVPMRAVIQVEDILSPSCELWPDKLQEFQQSLNW